MNLTRALLCAQLLVSAVYLTHGLTCTVNITSHNAGLSEAFGRSQIELSTPHSEYVCLQLPNGVSHLASSLNTTFSHIKSFAIIGAEKSVVQCANRSNIGLAFVNSSDIVFECVIFKYCGLVQNSTSRNFSSTTLSFVLSSAALYFSFCSDISMTDVTVFKSDGSALVLYNIGGYNTFRECTFNSSNHHNRPGGTGLIVDFSYCAPGDVHSNKVVNVGSHFLFKSSTFSDNIASSVGLNQDLLYPHGSDHMILGKGGGVSVGFAGHSKDNSLLFDNCTFGYNHADAGAGLYASFGDYSVNNTLTVINSDFSWNTLKDCVYIAPNKTNVGGGVKIELISYPPDQSLWPDYTSLLDGNMINFTNTSFFKNFACYGGAVALETSRNLSTNHLIFDKCEFLFNKARLSSAVDLSLHYPDHVDTLGAPIQPLFTDCNFTNNQVMIGDINNYSLGAGALYAARVPLTLAGQNRFTSNDGTAMVVLSTYVAGSEHSLTVFNDNYGRLGGAVALIGNAWVLSHDDSTFNFSHNSVKPGGLGGAIYSAHFGEHDFALNCFFQYHKPTVHPSNWTAKFVFTANTADDTPNSIYTTSSVSCQWPEHIPSSLDTPLSYGVFCDGHPWYFVDSNCSAQVRTAPNTLYVPRDHITAVPGWPADLNITAVDDYGHHIPAVVVAYPKDQNTGQLGVNDSTRYISNNKIILYGLNNTVGPMLSLQTLDPRVIVSQRPVDLLLCPPGFVAVPCLFNSDMTCDCVCPTPDHNGLGCTPGVNVTLYKHYCLTYQYSSTHTPNKSLPLVLAKCPYTFHKIALPLRADDLDEVVCGPLNRTGLLCSECKANHSVAINGQYECVSDCNPRVGWLIFLAVKIIPITIFFALIAMFNFKATSPSLNSFIFCGQIIAISSYHNPHPLFFGVLMYNHSTVLRALVEVPYGILNLDFLRLIVPPFCLGDISTLTAMVINYVVALYPILLIVGLYTAVKLYDRDVRVVRYLWRPFKWCLSKINKNRKQTTSVIDAIASYLLFSYTSFLYVSFPLLEPVTVLNAQNSSHPPAFEQPKFYFYAAIDLFGSTVHGALFVVVIVLIGLLIVAPPLFFILYPLKCMQRCISKLPKNIAIKTFAESFTESFRNGTEHKGAWDCRYFAGLYFLFRVAILLVFLMELDWAEQYFFQQILFTLGILLFALIRPYKKDAYNHLDTTMFVLLALLNSCSFYNSQRLLSSDISLPVFIMNYILVFVPLLYFVCLSLSHCLVSRRCLSRCYKKESAFTESIIVISEPSTDQNNEDPFSYVYNYEDLNAEDSDDFADRVLNPQNYGQDAYYVPRVPRITVTKATIDTDSSAQSGPMEASTEQSYFLRRQRQYGSTGEQGRSHTEPKSTKFQRFV